MSRRWVIAVCAFTAGAFVAGCAMFGAWLGEEIALTQAGELS